jgi:hypothetical protein
VTRGTPITGPSSPTIDSAIDALIPVGNSQPNMNYIVAVKFGGYSGNWVATGEPVQYIPEPDTV